MLLIIVLGLIAKLVSVCGSCNIGTEGMTNFDWFQVGINVLTQILKQAAFETSAWLYTRMFPLTKYKIFVLSSN
jgi:hypothetical protein